MGIASEYRRLAVDQRRAADAANLSMVRLKHIEAAEKWEILAEEMEHFEARCTPAVIGKSAHSLF